MRERLRRLLPQPVRDFLREHPEWEDEVTSNLIDGKEEPCLSTNCSLAFAVWCKENGVGDPAKADAFIRGFEDSIKRAFGEPTP
jgi:hypothetical protein